MSSGADDLERAHEAYARGDVKRALKLGWDAGVAAAAGPDDSQLLKAEELARLVVETSEGRLREEARSLADYCAAARANPRQRFGFWIRSERPPIGRSDDVKVCPDCAEKVKAAARVCRFCGYRFDEASPPPGRRAGRGS